MKRVLYGGCSVQPFPYMTVPLPVTCKYCLVLPQPSSFLSNLKSGTRARVCFLRVPACYVTLENNHFAAAEYCCQSAHTVEPHYNEVACNMKIPWLYPIFAFSTYLSGADVRQ